MLWLIVCIKGLGHLAAPYHNLSYLLLSHYCLYQKTHKKLPFSTCSYSYLKITCQYLLLLVGFDTLTYRKGYDRSLTLVVHQVLTDLISLWWVLYKGSFRVCDGRWWKKIRECRMLKRGDAPMHPQEISNESQASKLGDAPVYPLLHQQSSVRPSPCYMFISACVMC